MITLPRSIATVALLALTANVSAQSEGPTMQNEPTFVAFLEPLGKAADDPRVVQLIRKTVLQPPQVGPSVGMLGRANLGNRFPSSREEQCRNLLEALFQKPFPKQRPHFLTHPRSGHPLELDMYNKELGLAVEHDGLQHRAFVPWMHKTEDVFRAQQKRDRFKDTACTRAGVDLIRIPDTAPSPQDHLLGELRRLGRIS